MNFIKKIVKAFFKVNDEEMEMNLRSAEIKEGKAFLHPKDEEVTYCVASDDIKIILNNNQNIKITDITSIEK